MNARPSKRRRITPPADESPANPPHVNGVDSVVNETSEGRDGSDVSWDEEEGSLVEESGESDLEGLDDSEVDTSNVKQLETKPSPNERPPTRNSLHSSGEDGSSHSGGASSRSGPFEFRVDQLLQEVRPKRKKQEEEAEGTLRTLKGIIEDLPDIDPASVETAERNLLLSSRVATPFPHPRPRPNAKYTLAFARPSYINVVGSYALETHTKIDGNVSIDLVVQMPSDLFTEKDFLNYRYFHKRAYYLACIAAGIQKAKKLNVDQKFSYLNGDALRPILALRPSSQEAKNGRAPVTSAWQINVLLAFDAAVFPKSKTFPIKNCVRPIASTDETKQDTLPPTPFYNGSLRADCSAPAYLKLLHTAASQCPGFRDACYLGRIWLRQRGMSSLVQEGGFGHFEWATLMAFLLQPDGSTGRPALEKSLSSHHLFSSTVNFLASRNLLRQPLIVRSTVNEKPSRIPDVPMVFDGATGTNVLFKMTPWSYSSLQREAQITASILSGRSSNADFDSIFILRVSEPLDRYDLIAELRLDFQSRNPGRADSEGLLNFYSALSRGLGDRAVQINVLPPKEQPWPVNKAISSPTVAKNVAIGIVIDPKNSARTVDRGPSAEEVKAAASFRDFWGDKAELRRFKDGQILETVLWASKSALDITKEIISFLACRQFGENMDQHMRFIASESQNFQPQAQQQMDTLEADYRRLESRIRSLEGLPLQIRQMQKGGVEPHTSRLGQGSSEYHEITQVAIQFEGSGRWPDDLKAIQMTKVAFLLKMNELLADAQDLVISQIGIENGDYEILNKAYLEVAYSTGTAFRIRIYHDRERTLIEKRLTDKSIVPRDREEAARALAAYKRHFVCGPLYAQASQRLATRFTTYSETVRLVRAWFDVHLLGNHIAPEVIEVMTARTYLHPYPWQAPSTVQTGFLRTLLFLSRWDWQHEPLIVDFSAGMKPADRMDINTRFEAWRKVDPMMNRLALFVATDFDWEGSTWTEFKPAKVVAGRMKNLAAAARKVVRDKALDLDIGNLFKTGLSEYDFVLRLDRSLTSRHQKKDDTQKYKNLQKQASLDPGNIGFDPVKMLVDELELRYGDCAVFFYGRGADVIAGLWNPQTAKRAWKVNMTYSTVPIADGAVDGEEKDVQVAINKEAILSEMARLGTDMVVNIEIHR